MNSRIIVLALLFVVSLSANSFADPNQVTLEKNDDTVQVKICDHLFATYHFSKDLPKPFLYPVMVDEKTQLVRELRLDIKERTKEYDHIHHKGIWVSVDEVNDLKHWAEGAKIVNKRVQPKSGPGKSATLIVYNSWLDEKGKPLVDEKTTIIFHANRLLEYEIKFTASRGTVTFGDTKEGLLGVRLNQKLREKDGGTIKNANGDVSEKECWGKNASWVDYYGTADGTVCGVSLFDHPSNFRKARYHTRAYGLFTISPFGESAYTNGENKPVPTVLKKGQSLILKYGLYVHKGSTEDAGIEKVYQDYIK